MKLSHVLAVKITVTTFMWCLPLLTFSPSIFGWFGLPTPSPMVFARLLGAAYAALLVAYWHGILEARRGARPLAVIWVGLASNGLASIILFMHAVAGSWSSWPMRGQAFMWLSFVATSGISVALAVAGFRAPRSSEPALPPG